jgi:serine/threonine-protein kinase
LALTETDRIGELQAEHELTWCPRCTREHPPGEAYCQAAQARPRTPASGALVTEVPPVRDGENTLAIGTVIGPWTITRFLGAGAMGAVYEAMPQTGTRVAVKVLRGRVHGGTEAGAKADPATERFRVEAEATYKLHKHKSVIQIIAYGTLPAPDGRPYLVMEFLEGSSLDGRLRLDPPSRQELRRLLSEACDGLAAIHNAGIVHRDLKPDNMWVVKTEDGEISTKLLDFGISKMAGAKKLTEVGVAIGTPFYISPEQLCQKEADTRSDIYAFGVILYEVFSGRVPFCANDLRALMKQVVLDPPPPLLPRKGYTISRKLERLILDCLAKDPDARPQTARDLKERLLAALDEAALPGTAVVLAAITAPRRRVYLALAGSLVLALAVGIFAFWGRSGSEAKGAGTVAPPMPPLLPAARQVPPSPSPAASPSAAAATSAVPSRKSADPGTRVARKNPRSASATLPSSAARPASLLHPEAAALQPGPAPAPPALAASPPADRRLAAPSSATISPPTPLRAVFPEVETPRPAHPLTPSERDLITDKNILFR